MPARTTCHCFARRIRPALVDENVARRRPVRAEMLEEIGTIRAEAFNAADRLATARRDPS